MTKKRRINLVVDDDVFETVTEMARMQGKSRAGLIMELVRSVHPVLQQTLLAMKAAEAYQGKIPDELAQAVESDLDGVIQSSQDQLDLLTAIGEKLSDRPEEGADADACPSGRS